MTVASLANRIQVNTNCANNDVLYGPYNSIAEAISSIPPALLNGEGARGRTIGVLEDDKVVEYWWQPQGEGYDFVKKYDGSVDVTMGEAFTTNMAVGGIDSGTQIKATDTIKTIIKNMLLKLKQAFVKSNPSASISPTGGNVEYGTTVSSAFTANLIDGKFTQYTNGGTSTQDISMGCTKTSAAFQKKVGSGSYTDYTNGTSFKVDETTSIKAIVSHSTSTVKPTNSDGSSTLSYPEGSKEITATYTPKFGWFFVTLDVMPESVTRQTFGSYKGLITGAFNTTQSFDKKVVLLAIPSAYKLSSALSANNEEQTYDESSITITDAGGTDRSYKLFAFKYDAVLGVNVTFKITT